MIRKPSSRGRRLQRIACNSLIAVCVSLLAAFSVSNAHLTNSAAQPATRIREIQGAAHVSALNGRAVSGVVGIVTVNRANGFFMQDPAPDNDPRTSEGIFVLAPPRAGGAVGDRVSVNGTVSEARQGANAETNANLSVTQINSTSVAVLSSGNALPAPVVIGNGGRRPPVSIIEDDARGNVESGGAFDPASDGLDFYESLEGMRVRVGDAVAVGHSFTLRNGTREIPVAGDRGRFASLRTPRGGLVIRPGDFNPERIFLSGELTELPELNVGDRFNGALEGVLDYSSGNYKLLVTRAPAVLRAGLARETTTAVRPNQLAVAAFNVENLDPGDSAEKFQRLADIVVKNLKSPDLVAIEEIQDNNGATNDALVDAGETFGRLISTIRARGGPAYSFRNINPVDDQDGGEPGGNIRIGFLFRTDRGLRFTDRPGGGSTVSTSVSSAANVPRLSSSPGRVEASNPAFNQTRKPLAGEFTFNGHRLFVVANHLSSKGGDNPLFGRFQPPVFQSERKRHQQAESVNKFVNSILAVDRDANVIVLGDLNDFQFSTTLKLLAGDALRNLFDTLPPGERYTYIFDGNSQALDHILVSQRLFAALVRFDVVHINSEFAEQASDHDPPVAIFRLPAR
ncbi:MAG TPA: endonuclease/exonuclease/phosphatase family protein [Pyrinomonadaceae bacterium]|jgi:predicted extracellular nuclease|nr:endonuclease/exonuclease/phosphatase family protein [Pyrinomonadaceae bacterium]